MFQETFKVRNFSVFFTLLIIKGFPFHIAAVQGNNSQRNISLSRNHVSVWLDSPLKDKYRYRKFNLEGLVNLVSGTFGTIAMPSVPQLPTLSPPEEFRNSKVLIPNVVAEHNRKSASDKLMKIMVSFDETSDSKSSVNDFKSFIVAKNCADQANAIYSGTVDTLLLHDENHFRVNLSETDPTDYIDLPRKLLKFRTKLNGSRSTRYKLGITVSLEMCGNNQEETQIISSELLKRITKEVDLVIPVVYVKPPSQYLFQPFDEHEIQIATFTTCERILKKAKRELDLEIIPLIICNPPKSQNDSAGLSRFLECWQLMRNWAEGNNRSVIMYQAFDTFDKDFVKGAGWWRLKKENLQYVSESSFVEKARDSFSPNKTEEKKQPTTTTFVDSRVRLSSYSEQEVSEILKTISTQACTIVTNQDSILVGSSSSKYFTWLPEAVAKFNVENQNASDSQPLTVISTFSDTNNIPLHLGDSSSGNFSYNPELALRIATSANDLFPGTVTTLVYDGLRGSSITKNLAKLNKTLDSGLGRKMMESGIRVGIFIDLVACQQYLNTSFGIDWIDLFIIDLRGLTSASPPDALNPYPILLLKNKLGSGETCFLEIKKIYPQAYVMMAVNCSEIVGKSTKRTDDMKKCTKTVSEWANKKNIEFIFSHELNVPPPVFLPNEDNQPFLPTSSWILMAGSGFIFILILAIALVVIQTLRLQRKQAILSRIELAEFFDGTNANNDAGSKALELKDDTQNVVMNVKYDAKKFEIPKQDFRFDSTILGKGNYGVVRKLFVSKFATEVAVKVPHSNCSRSTLKSLLSEIKIMSFVGENKHVVQFLGAYTKEIERGIVYIVTELCGMGSLQSHLLQMSKYDLSPPILNELTRFCFEIALGMQFISEKGVIHGDLSARNVLLGHNATCKISDFGLSKKLYQYEIYTKKQQEALPWRWLAIETLKRMEFSTKSDMWAYGVTVWEIFSFGDLPYSGHIWNFDFVEALESGMRMKQPKIAPDEIFTKVQECWQTEKDDRPAFDDLVNFFQGLRGNEYILI